MIQATFISLLHLIYDIHSEESEYTQIISIQYDYHIKKKQYNSRVVHDILLDQQKKIIVDFYISYNATIRNKYVFRYVSDISRINIKS